MNFKFKITVILGLQFSQILRFITFLIISAIFTKYRLTHLTRADVGDWELMMLISAALSYFWVTGIIQSFLPLYNNNHIFPKKTHFREKSPELFNTFLILCAFSCSFAILIYIFRNNIFVYKDLRKVPHAIPLVIYFILSNISPLIEYIYYLRNRPYQIMNYIFWISAVQLVVVCGPVILGMGINMAIWGLIAISAVRVIWLFSIA